MNCLIIVNYRSEDDLYRWASNCDKAKVDYILVNNDITENITEPKFPNAVKIISLSDNPGYAAGVNAGLKVAISLGYSKFAVINPDIEFDCNNLTKFFDVIEDRIIVSPLVIGKDGVEQIPPRMTTGGMYPFQAIFEKFKKSWPSFNGCFWGATLETVLSIGLLDERWFLFGEEREYSYRAIWLGVDCRVNRSITAIHRTSSSLHASGVIENKQVMIENNRFEFMKRAHKFDLFSLDFTLYKFYSLLKKLM